MRASDLADFPATNEALVELTWWLKAAFVSDAEAIPDNENPLRVAISAMAARKHRIFFMILLFMPAFQASNGRFIYPLQSQGMFRNRMGPSDYKVSISGKLRQMNTIWVTYTVYLEDIGRALKGHFLHRRRLGIFPHLAQ